VERLLKLSEAEGARRSYPEYLVAEAERIGIRQTTLWSSGQLPHMAYRDMNTYSPSPTRLYRIPICTEVTTTAIQCRLTVPIQIQFIAIDLTLNPVTLQIISTSCGRQFERIPLHCSHRHNAITVLSHVIRNHECGVVSLSQIAGAVAIHSRSLTSTRGE
jgi:hypothetical protein